METILVDPARPDEAAISRAAAALSGGSLVAFPTETFYALGADPRDESALRRLCEMKGRPSGLPVLLLVGGFDQIPSVSDPIPGSCERLAAAFWPGPLTLVLRARPQISSWITAGTGTVGVRVPGLGLARALARALGHPVTGTSANLSGRPPASTASEVREAFGDVLDLLIDGGPSAGGAPSTVVDLTSDRPRLIRAGAVDFEQVLAVFDA